MAKALTKPAFGVPSTELVGRIKSSDAVSAVRAAGYGFEASLSELGRQYDAKAASCATNTLGSWPRSAENKRRSKTAGGTRESVANSGFLNFSARKRDFPVARAGEWEARSFLGETAMHKEDEAHCWVSSLTARPDP
jgi:hypothetical protein